MKVYIVTINNSYNNEVSEEYIEEVFQNKEDAKRELLKIYNTELYEQKAVGDTYEATISNNSFSISCENECEQLVMVGKIIERELK